MPRPEGIEEWMEECREKAVVLRGKIELLIREYEKDTGAYVSDVGLIKWDATSSQQDKKYLSEVKLSIDFL